MTESNLIIAILLIPAVIALFSEPGRWLLIAGLWLTCVFLLTLRAWMWPKLSYRYTSYRLSDRGLVIRRGVLWRSVAHVHGH